MTGLPDHSFDRLRSLVDLPDLRGTRYDDPRLVARGGMGSVFSVYDRELDRRVAFKVLTVADETGHLMQRLTDEARIIAQLEHPSIVPIHDVGRLDDGRVFYTMKLVRGETLTEWVAEVRSLPEKLQIMRQVCLALAFAHAHGVIHRDLKPDNVMVGAFGEVLVMDWGVARSTGRPSTSDDTIDFPEVGRRDTAHGTIIGTPGFMAPEQLKAGDGGVDAATDIYLLGGTLYFLLTGRAPWKDEKAGSPAARETAPDPRAVNRAIGRPLAAICRKAMAPDGSLRYVSAEAMAHDLDLYLSNEPVGAYPENVLQTTARWLNKNQLIVYILLTYIIIRALIFIFLNR